MMTSEETCRACGGPHGAAWWLCAPWGYGRKAPADVYGARVCDACWEAKCNLPRDPDGLIAKIRERDAMQKSGVVCDFCGHATTMSTWTWASGNVHEDRHPDLMGAVGCYERCGRHSYETLAAMIRARRSAAKTEAETREKARVAIGQQTSRPVACIRCDDPHPEAAMQSVGGLGPYCPECQERLWSEKKEPCIHCGALVAGENCCAYCDHRRQSLEQRTRGHVALDDRIAAAKLLNAVQRIGRKVYDDPGTPSWPSAWESEVDEWP